MRVTSIFKHSRCLLHFRDGFRGSSFLRPSKDFLFLRFRFLISSDFRVERFSCETVLTKLVRFSTSSSGVLALALATSAEQRSLRLITGLFGSNPEGGGALLSSS